MKASRLISFLVIFLLLTSCNSKDKKSFRLAKNKIPETVSVNIPIDKGFSEYITAYTSGVIPSNSAIEIHFTPEFALKANKSVSDLFEFEPTVKGKTEWRDETTLVFTPAHLLKPETTFTVGLNFGKLTDVKEKLKIFPLRIQTVKKDFHVTIGTLECPDAEGKTYTLNGQILTADVIEPEEAENYLTAKLGRKKMLISWDHSFNLIHKFSIKEIVRTDKAQELLIAWDR